MYLLQVEHLIGWIMNAFASLAMSDYPYPSEFLAPLPAYPVNVSIISHNVLYSCMLIFEECKFRVFVLVTKPVTHGTFVH